MKLLSHLIDQNTPSYGNKSPILIQKASCMHSGASSNSLTLTLSNHIGTHIDLPAHFDASGKRLEDYPLDQWYFRSVQLIDLALSPEELISVQHLSGKIQPRTEVLLLRTGFEKHRGEELYWKNNPGIAEETGHWLRDQFHHLKVLGLDFISVSCYQKREIGQLAHRALLGSYKSTEAIRVVEDMRLSELHDAPRNLLISPTLIRGADGIQVTVWANLP